MKQVKFSQNISLTIDDIPTNMRPKNKLLKVSNQNEVYYLNTDLILYVEADGNYSDIHLVDGDVLKTVGFQRSEIARMMEMQLDSDVVCKFALVGKFHLINLEHIMYINVTQQQLLFDVNLADSCQKKSIKVSVNALRNLRLSLDELPKTKDVKPYQNAEYNRNGFLQHVSTPKPLVRNYDIDDDEVMILG